MSRWTDLAQWVGPTVNQGPAMTQVRGIILHIAEGSQAGTIAWQKNPAADVSSHFISAKNGQLVQMVDTDMGAWTQQNGNGQWISIEHEGFHTQSLTPQQIENAAKLLARTQQQYGTPARRNYLVLADNPNAIGLGWHGMGGAGWGGHYDCPGPSIVAQRQTIIARAQQILGFSEDPVASLQDDPDFVAMKWRLHGLISGLEAVAEGPTKGEKIIPNIRLREANAKLDQLLARDVIPIELEDQDVTDIAAQVATRINTDLAAKTAELVADVIAERMQQ